jgi:hypothetical protein
MSNLLFLLGLGIFIRELVLLYEQEKSLENTKDDKTPVSFLTELAQQECVSNPIEASEPAINYGLNFNYLDKDPTQNLIAFLKRAEEQWSSINRPIAWEMLMDREFELLYRYTSTMEKFTTEEANFIRLRYLELETKETQYEI